MRTWSLNSKLGGQVHPLLHPALGLPSFAAFLFCRLSSRRSPRDTLRVCSENCVKQLRVRIIQCLRLSLDAPGIMLADDGHSGCKDFLEGHGDEQACLVEPLVERLGELESLRFPGFGDDLD